MQNMFENVAKTMMKHGQSGENRADRPKVLASISAGFFLIVMLIGGFIGWSAFAPLQSAAIAQGAVNLDSYRKTVQHYEGGIVQDIMVREGQRVEKDDVLLQLDETRARASQDLLEAQIEAEEKQLLLIDEEIKIVELLLEKGLAKKPRILELYRHRAQLQGSRTEHIAQLHAAKDVITRAKIRAPIAGSVVGLQVHTTGGVIKAGDPLLSIVPKDEPLVIEARIDPNDIDVVRSGLPAQVRLTPFNARTVPPLPGVVAWISADSMRDQATGASFYLARIKLDAEPSRLPEDMQLYPGMPAEIMVVTGKRSFMEYLTAPLLHSYQRAFREQ